MEWFNKKIKSQYSKLTYQLKINMKEKIQLIGKMIKMCNVQNAIEN